jgi:hypothetical protein
MRRRAGPLTGVLHVLVEGIVQVSTELGRVNDGGRGEDREHLFRRDRPSVPDGIILGVPRH